MLLGLAAVFLVVNVATVDLVPLVWVDEVMYADPAVNLYLGHGFRSTAWPAQPQSETWMSNSPLYQGLLFLWMQIFGFSLATVRSFNHVLAVGLLAGIWLAVRRRRLLRRSSSRVLLMVLLACGFGFTFIYRSGRPDLVAMMPMVLALLAATLASPAARGLALFCCGALVPVSGLAAVAFLAVLGGLLLVFLGRRVLALLLSLGAGVVAGAGILLGVLEHVGLREPFLRATLAHSSVPGQGGGSHTLFARIAARLGENTDAVFLDRSALFLGLGALLVVGVLARRRRLVLRSPMVFAVLAAVWIPTLVAAAGKYPLYYSWMAYVPLTLAFLRHREELTGGLRTVTHVAVVLAVVVGLPLQLGIAWWDREVRDYRQVERLVAEVVSEGDRVYCDFACYYPAKARAAAVFLPTYNRHFTAREMRELDAVILRLREPGAAYVWWAEIHPALAQEWQPTDRGVAVDRAGIRFLRFHWPYTDYRSLRVYARRAPPHPDAAPRAPAPE